MGEWRMALESWDGLRLGLMALGYRSIICVDHGVFKLGVSEEMDTYPCPECGAACKVFTMRRRTASKVP